LFLFINSKRTSPGTPSQRLILNGGNYREKLQKPPPTGKKLAEEKVLN
jgi:hypothetical protein